MTSAQDSAFYRIGDRVRHLAFNQSGVIKGVSHGVPKYDVLLDPRRGETEGYLVTNVDSIYLELTKRADQ